MRIKKPARGGDLKRALDVLLPLHVGKVRYSRGFIGDIRRRAGAISSSARRCAMSVRTSFTVDLQPVGKGGLARVVRRNESRFYPRALRRDRHGQRP